MRKQTKVVAVTSAAALLAIGASMTSFAATGWVQENGEWFWYDRDGSRVEDEWKKSGNDWYWLDSEENGAMALDKLIEDDGDTYYVNSTGAMVRNAWISIVNEDQDDDDDPAEYNWYYFQSNGKAYTKGDGDTTKFRTINGKRYAFDDDGKMLYGWVDDSGERKTDDEDWKEAETCYYLGDWNDGSMKTGWQKITVYDGNPEVEDDRDYWFNFKPNGKKRTSDDAWKYNGKEYAFDSRGVMLYQWATVDDSKKAESSPSDASASNLKNVKEWRYYNSPEDGARVTKGWFKVIAPDEDNDNTFLKYDDSFADGDAKDETERWYYAKAKGELVEGEIYNIKGKYYGFWPNSSNKAGAMLNGLCVLQMNDDGKIETVIADNISSDDLDDILDGEFSSTIKVDDSDVTWSQKDSSQDWSNVYLYYFGNDADSDGAMKTGNVTINLDGSTYTFLFKKTGNPAGGKGRGVTGIEDDKYIYQYGCRIKADSDDKYQLVKVTDQDGGVKKVDINSDDVYVEKVKDTPDWCDWTYTNSDGDTVRYHYDSRRVDDDIDFSKGLEDNGKSGINGYYLVNASGNIQSNKMTGVKDGNDCFYYVNKDRSVVLYTDNKNLKSEKNITVNKITSNNAEDFIKNYAGLGTNKK